FHHKFQRWSLKTVAGRPFTHLSIGQPDTDLDCPCGFTGVSFRSKRNRSEEANLHSRMHARFGWNALAACWGNWHSLSYLSATFFAGSEAVEIDHLLS